MLIGQGILSTHHQTVVPDKILYLDISVATAMKRLSERSEVKEIYEKRSKIERHHRGYKWLLEQYPSEFNIIDGEQDMEGVTEVLIKAVQKL